MSAASSWWPAPVIARSRLVESVPQALSRSRVVAMLGPRQCGKTTVGGPLLAKDSSNYGQIWSHAAIAGAMNIGEKSVRSYLDVLTDLYMLRQLQPWHANLKKRQVKSPKVYFRDTGLLHYLLGVRTEKELWTHPKCGASWEGYAIEESLKAVQPEEAFFWATHQGAEIDLVLIKDGRMLGVECKRVDAPRLTPSMRIALDDLKLERIAVVYPGAKRFPLAERVEAVPLDALVEGMKGLFPE